MVGTGTDPLKLTFSSFEKWNVVDKEKITVKLEIKVQVFQLNSVSYYTELTHTIEFEVTNCVNKPAAIVPPNVNHMVGSTFSESIVWSDFTTKNLEDC